MAHSRRYGGLSFSRIYEWPRFSTIKACFKLPTNDGERCKGAIATYTQVAQHVWSCETTEAFIAIAKKNVPTLKEGLLVPLDLSR